MIIAVIYATFAVANQRKESLKKNQACTGLEPLSSAIPNVRIESRTSLNFNFLGFLFATAKVAYITARIILQIILHSALHIYDFHIFITY